MVDDSAMVVRVACSNIRNKRLHTGRRNPIDPQLFGILESRTSTVTDGIMFRSIQVAHWHSHTKQWCRIVNNS